MSQSRLPGGDPGAPPPIMTERERAMYELLRRSELSVADIERIIRQREGLECPRCGGRMATETEEGCTAASCVIGPSADAFAQRVLDRTAEPFERVSASLARHAMLLQRARAYAGLMPEELVAEIDRVLVGNGQRIQLTVPDIRNQPETEEDALDALVDAWRTARLGGEQTPEEQQGDVILAFARETIEAGASHVLQVMASEPFRPESLFIPLGLADDIVIEHIRVGMRAQCTIGPAGIPASLFSWTCGHAECEGTARDSDDKLIDPEHAHALMIACMQKHKDARSRFLRRLHFDEVYPGLQVIISVRNVARVALPFEAALVGPRVRRRIPRERAVRQMPLGFGTEVVAPQATVRVVAQPQIAVRPTNLVVPDAVAPHFMIEGITIGTREQFAVPGGQGVPAAAFIPMAVGAAMELDRAEPRQIITITARNTSNEPRTFMATLICTADDAPMPTDLAMQQAEAVQAGLTEGLERPNVALAEAIRRSHARNGVIPTAAELERTLMGQDTLRTLVGQGRPPFGMERLSIFEQAAVQEGRMVIGDDGQAHALVDGDDDDDIQSFFDEDED